MPMSPEEKRARRKARRQARRSQSGVAASQMSGMTRVTKPHERLEERDYAERLVRVTELEVVDPEDRTWTCFSIPYLQSRYPSPAQAAEVLLERVAELGLTTVTQVTIFPAGGLIGFGPVQVEG